MEKDSKNIEKTRHSLAHILALMVKGRWSDTKLGMGPAIENGFYYDFEFQNHTPSSEDLSKLEDDMKSLIKQDIQFTREEISIEEAKKIFKSEPYKLELIKELEQKSDTVSIYRSGDLIDLCQGPHIESTKEINPEAFRLTKIAGAYWKGDENNQMLTRIYGVAFETKKELDDYLKNIEEAEKRDHRKLGKELDLFTFSNLVGSGLPLFTPKGTLLRDLIGNKIYEIQSKFDYKKVWIPHIAKKELYEISGHWAKYKDSLFHVKGKSDTEFVMKPMNCPHHTQIYASTPKSYRDLPIRFVEITTNYRDEQPGELLGLSRVRSLTQDDGHIFCSLEQVEEEVKNIIHIIREFYTLLGMFDKKDYWVSLSVRDSKTPENYIGDEKHWDEAEKILEKVAKSEDLNYKKIEGEAAFYGPKLDFMFKDSLGREWQLATIQVDFSMPERFELKYTDKDGTIKTPVMIHRAIAGSLERFLSVIIEHFAGEFPLWLSPVQAMIIPVSEKFNDYGDTILDKLKENNIRVEIDTSNDTLGKRIRTAEIKKIPYIIVVGGKEEENKTISVRSKEKGDEGAIEVDKFIDTITKEITKK
ncbi:MAG: threonine--tRNA ligase [Parcubacteria group bacterium]|nr:threonine--tRNA ligase [Parcubacteria group bacterium]MCR4342388.1 threonine--tRNA ligase [Patescibacteria group bacterium]